MKTVRIDYEFDGNTAKYRITDEGEGFEWQEFLEDSEPDDLLASNGRGIMISRFIFDRVTYFGKGNEVLLEKDV